jgi:mannitol-1-phosphate/altronate dehydrogenase
MRMTGISARILRSTSRMTACSARRWLTGLFRAESEMQRQTLRWTRTNGYEDNLKDVGEVFGVWYIEGPKELEDKLPFKKAGLNVHVVPEVAPYKKRKVRILNGAHTGFVLGAYLAAKDIVRRLHAR